MGRFYKTSAANPMDYMYRIPAEMMMKVMQGNEMQIQNILNTTDLYKNTVLKIPHLTQHNKFMEEKQKYYNDKTTGISKAILEDPSAWRKYQTSIKDIGRELQEDMLTGDLSKVQGSYNTLQEQLKKNQELAKKGMKGGVGYNDKELEMLTQAQLNNWKGFDDNGKVTQLQLEGGTETYNFAEYFPTLLKELKASGEISKIPGGDDLWIKYQTNGWEGIDKQKALQVLNEKLNSNIPFWNSINQREKYNIPGYSGITVDGKKQLIKEVKRKNKEGKEYVTYEPYDNALSYGLFGAADAKSYMKIKNMIDLESNPYGLQKQSFAHAERMEVIKEQNRINAENRAAEREKEKQEIEGNRKAFELMTKDENPVIRQQGYDGLMGIDKILDSKLNREEESVFTVDELKPYLNSYIEAVNSPYAKSGEGQQLIEQYQNMFGKFMDKYKLSEQELADVMAVKSGSYTKDPNLYGGTKRVYQPGYGMNKGFTTEIPILTDRYRKAMSNIQRLEKANTEGKDILEDIANNIQRPTNPFMIVNDNTAIGRASSKNIINGLNLEGNVITYTSGYNHRKDGNLKGSNKPRVEIDRDVDKGWFSRNGLFNGDGDAFDIEKDPIEAAKIISKESGVPLDNIVKVNTQRAEGNSIVADIQLNLPEGYKIKSGDSKFKIVLKRGAENLLPLLQNKELQKHPDFGDFERTFNPNYKYEAIVDEKFNLVQSGLKETSGRYGNKNYSIKSNGDGTYKIKVNGEDVETSQPITNIEQVKTILKFVN